MGSSPTPATTFRHVGRLPVGHPCVKVLRPDFDAWDHFQARNPGFRIERMSRELDKVDAESFAGTSSLQVLRAIRQLTRKPMSEGLTHDAAL